MANQYDVGSLVRVKGAFTDSTGNPVDPSVVKLNYRPGNSSTVTTWTYLGTGSIVRDSQGNYHADLDTSAAPGDWHYRWWSTGTGQAASDAVFIAQATSIP